MRRSLKEAVLILLLLLSIVSTIYLALSQEVGTRSIAGALNRVKLSPSVSIGVVDINGVIYAGDQKSLLSQSYHEDILNTIKSYAEDDTVKAVILRINSPGGTVGAVQEIVSAVERLKKTGKPVIASVSDIAASGGYYIASVCDRVVANGGSTVGSIGAVIVSADASSLLEKIGVKVETIKSGPYKDVGSYYRPLVREEKEFLNNLVEDAYSQFVETVSAGRKMNIGKVRALAKGQIYTWRQAVGNGLVDELGDIYRAKELAEGLAGVKDASLVRRRFTRLTKILGFLRNRAPVLFPVSENRVSGLCYLFRP